MPHDLPVTLALVALTLASAAAAVLALRRLLAPAASAASSASTAHDGEAESTPAADALPRIVRLLPVGLAVGAAAVLTYRWAARTSEWELLAHVDGLLLMSLLLAVTAWYIQGRPQLRGLAGFVLAGLTLLLAWAVCAAAWTYHPFNLQRLDPAWAMLHLGGVYLGTISAALAAAAGAMYLVVHHRLKSHQPPARGGRLASLETLETLIVRAATLGFVLLTLGLVAGLVIVVEDRDATRLGPTWYLSPKVLLAAAAWALYAVLMNARRAAAFRGAYAAWLSIAAVALLIAVYGLATAFGDDTESGTTHPPATPSTPATPGEPAATAAGEEGGTP